MSRNYRTFLFTADTINGVIQQFPKQYFLRCGQVTPIGLSIVRNYTGTECIQAMTVFLIQYDGELLGNSCFKSFSAFMRFYQAVCQSSYLLLNGCNMTLNGCVVNI